MCRKSAIRRLLKRLPKGPVRNLDPLAFASPAALPVQSRQAAPSAPEITEDEAFALECASLERLRDASSLVELDANWAASLSKYQQRGAELPLRVEATYRELREGLVDASATNSGEDV
jgi:hypothetical protein